MEEMLQSILRTLISFIILIIVTMAIGKHINSHKNYYSFALSITIGSFIANMGFDTNLDFTEILFSLITLIFVFYLCLLLSSRSRKLRMWFSGRPTVLIEKGKILDENMKKIKFSLDDLNQHLRENGVFEIYEVEYALLEVSGDLSILKKKDYQCIVRKDIQLSSDQGTLPIELIMDGKVITKNLTSHYNKDWILSECHKRKLKIEEIYYAVINSNGSLFIDKFNDQIISPTDIE